jgi:DNA repair exonuclease SbcCD ATPase subunit
MHIAAKILAGINIVVSCVVIYLAAEVVAARLAWVRALDAAAKMRDGEVEIFDEAIARDEVLKKLPKERQDDIKRIFRTAHERRKAAAGVSFDTFRADKAQLTESQEAKGIMKEFGPDYYRQIVREEIQDQAPQLRDEEQRIATTKANQVSMREDYKKQLTQLDDQIEQLKKDKNNEKALTDQMLAENAQRQRELVRLYAELEEGLNARNLAQSRENDLREQLQYMQAKLRRLADENQKLATEITRLEAGQ